METSILTPKGQLLIPKRLRDKYGLQPGIKIVFEESKNGLIVKPMNKNYFKQFRGKYKNLPTKEEWLKYKKEERAIEDNKLKRFDKKL
ncbi:MAG: AbrB/MazE/SpoVT family DNA-binding domain-containing protein [Chitinophagaceae bacterium]